MIVSLYLLAAYIADVDSTTTANLVAAVALYETLAAFWTVADLSSTNCLFHGKPSLGLMFLFDLITSSGKNILCENLFFRVYC